MAIEKKTIIKEDLYLVLVDLGLKYRQARSVVNAIFDAMTIALKRHDVVELPFGTLRVVEYLQKQHRRWRFGQPQEVFKKRYHVVITPRESEIR